MATIMYPSLTKSQSMRSKRKSAVELLAESKPFYVKSEVVRDNTQALPTRPTSTTASGLYGTYNRSKSVVTPGHGTNYRPTTLPQCKKHFIYHIRFLNILDNNNNSYKFD